MLVDVILDALSILEQYANKKFDEIVKDRTVVSAILWNLYVVVQGSIDLALKCIPELNLRQPETYADAFNVLYEAKMIPKELRDNLVKMAKFRNRLAHAYAGIDLNRIYEILTARLKDIHLFLKLMHTELKKKNIDISKL